MVANPWIPKKRTVMPDGCEWIGPHSKQQRFLLHSDTREVMYGGAARGGKSEALLMAAAQFLHVPGYAALILRRNFPDLKQSEGMIPRSHEWWANTRASWNSQDKQWTFPCPSGGTSLIRFGFCDRETDVFQYQGSAYHCVCWDELTQFAESQYRYLFSRQSRPTSGPLAAVPLRMRAGSNPGGVGHEWVKERFITGPPAVGRFFVPARLEDNPSVDYASYVDSLSNLDPLTRAQLLAGDWDAVAGGRFKREWFRRYSRIGDGFRLLPEGRHVEGPRVWRFQTCDTAASIKESADWTVISTWGVTPRYELLWLDCVRGKWEVPDILPQLEAAYAKHRPRFLAIETVAGHSGTGVYQLARRTAMIVKPLTPKGDKLIRATPAIVLCETGRLYIPEWSEWLDDALAELVRFTGDEKVDSHDDVVDTLAYAALELTSYTDGQATGGVPRVIGYGDGV